MEPAKPSLPKPQGAGPLLILAPMQDVTDLPFWNVLHAYGGADLYYTEYFRVHPDSRPERHILEAIRGNPTGRPVLAQMIGQDIPSLVQTSEWLLRENILGIDLNLGCPAPIVCRKNAGGGLLRHPEQIDAILTALRPTIDRLFTVKTRVGYESPSGFAALLEIFARHPIDALTVHGRTVREMYRPWVHYDQIAAASSRLSCPVFANGSVSSGAKALAVTQATNAKGLMIGRGAIRNPWIFEQIRRAFAGKEPLAVKLRDVRAYIQQLYEQTCPTGAPETARVGKMKKYLNYIASGIGPEEEFLKQMRQALTLTELFRVCDAHLDNDLPFEDPQETVVLSPG